MGRRTPRANTRRLAKQAKAEAYLFRAARRKEGAKAGTGSRQDEGTLQKAEARLKPNYIAKIERMIDSGEIPTTPGLNELKVSHDDWCAIFYGGNCDCDPDIRLLEKRHA